MPIVCPSLLGLTEKATVEFDHHWLFNRAFMLWTNSTSKLQSELDSQVLSDKLVSHLANKQSIIR